MSWQDDGISMLRVLVNDLDCGDDQSYSDARLEQVLIVSARYVLQDLSFDTSYVVNIGACSITPDPSATATVDNDTFMNMMVLKAACLTDWSTFRQKALVAGVKARCGPVILDTLGHMDGFKTLLNDGPCATYDELKVQHQFGNTNTVRAILSPFVGNNFNPNSLSSVRTYSHRDR